MKRGRRASGAVASSHRRRRTGWPWLVVLVALLVAWASDQVIRSNVTAHPPSPADSVGTLDPATAYARGIERSRAGHITDALPYLRRAAVASPARWEYLAVYGTALSNASLDPSAHRGFGGPRARSSWERTRLSLESLAYLARAESLATQDADRERIARRRAVLLANWGFTRDAEYQLARTR
jgi:hypothetical protein